MAGDGPEHLRAGAAIGLEPCAQALDADVDQRPDRQQVPGQALHGAEEGEGRHRGVLYAGVFWGWISGPFRLAILRPSTSGKIDPRSIFPEVPPQAGEDEVSARLPLPERERG
ncbi:MAG: hypothetical protein VR74_13585 [Hyphomonas sp. BRH_c22]|nr:MAG: hypothetical protein VR74_13585 [Hyphomonas sp. BRH_c22]